MAKKKTTKQKDFVKKKLKVGKTKAKANNATNVQFKSQKIALPNQVLSIADGLDRGEEELKAILHSLQHHNESNRQDALLKMKSLFKTSPAAFISLIGLVSNALARSILDLSDSFGKMILAFCRDFFELVSPSEIAPFFPIFAVYAGSAMTHINHNVRLRGLKFLSLLCEKFPDLIRTHAGNLVEQYVQIMAFGKNVGINSSSKNSQITQIKAKEEILNAFEIYISLILSVEKSEVRPLLWDQQAILDLGLFDSSNDTESKSLSLNTKEGKKDFLRKKCGLEQLGEIVPILLDFWIEASEMVFSVPEVGQSPTLNVCFAIVRVLRLIWHQVVSDSAEEKVRNWSLLIVKHIQPQFPFGKGNSSRDMTTWNLLNSMNLRYIIVAADIAERSKLPEIFSSIETYMIEMFESKRKLAGDRPLEETSVSIIEILSKNLKDEGKNRLLQSIISFQSSARSNAVSKTGFFMIKKLDDKIQENKLISNWIKTLPKLLWKIKLQSLDYSKEIISLLRTRVIADPGFGQTIILSLLPLFAIKHDDSFIYGPFIGYPSDVQELLLSLLYYIPSWPQTLIPTDLNVPWLTACAFLRMSNGAIDNSSLQQCSRLILSLLKLVYDKSDNIVEEKILSSIDCFLDSAVAGRRDLTNFIDLSALDPDFAHFVKKYI